jgi:sialic acid synthase SpsE
MDCTNTHLLKYIAQTGKPIYLSTGMATLDEIANTIEYLKEKKSGPITLLHCISIYPAMAGDLNLHIIPFLKHLFDLPVGYSDHYPGTTACLAAAMMGAEVIETHFTLDSSKEGGDHRHSAEPDALKKLMVDIALFRTMQGDKRAIFHRPDRRYARDYRRGLYAAGNLPKGKILQEEDFLLCRPISELSPNDLTWLIGKTLEQEISSHQSVRKAFVQREVSES